MEERPTDSQQSPDSFELVLVKLWHQEFNAESDRAAVILGASKLDQLLRELLVKKFLPNPTSQDDLFDSDKPIASFSSRINVAYRLGLIDKQFANSLHLIRRIRNEFAHEAVGASLGEGAHRDRVKTLVAAFSKNKYFEEYCSNSQLNLNYQSASVPLSPF